MLTEKGTLPVGIEFDGQTHREFEIREQLVGDSVSIFDDPARAKRATANTQYASVCVLAGQIMSLGSIPKESITGDLLLEMHEDDFSALREADNQLSERRKSFREGR